MYLNWLNKDDPNWMRSQLFGKRVVDTVFVAGLIVCWLKILWFDATKSYHEERSSCHRYEDSHG